MQQIDQTLVDLVERLKQNALSSKTSEISVQDNKEYLCNTCKDEGGYTVIKKAGETRLVRDFEGTFREVTLKRDTEVYQECTCAKMRKINRLIKSSSITEEFQKMGFSNFDETKVDPHIAEMKERALQYYTDFDSNRTERVNSALFSGQSGCGKTHLLTAVSNNLMFKKQIPVLYFPFKDGMNDISANNFEQKNHIMQQMKDIDVLFIDDLFKPIGGKLEYDNNGSPKIIKWQADIIFEIFNHRYLNKKPMLISTELSIEEMIAIDEAMTSRIFEMASDYTVLVPKNVLNNYRFRKLRGGA